MQQQKISVMLISLGDCSRYGDCFACLDSSDAYCGWDKDARRCVNKISSDAPRLLQSVLITEADIVGECGERSATTSPPPRPCDVQTSTTDSVKVTEAKDDCINCTTNTGWAGIGKY